MRVAIIDLGTNTFNLLIAEKAGDGLKILHTGKIAVRLGSGGLMHKRIQDDAFSRGIDAMKIHHTEILKYNCDQVKGIATSMIRDSVNGKEFVSRILAETGIHVEIVDGDREAELIWKGVREIVSPGEKFLIMDIGGGSTEFIIADTEKIYWKKSYQLGVTRLYEYFRHSDPITPDETEKIESFFSLQMQDLFAAIKTFEVKDMIGSAGSFETFLSMISWKKNDRNYDPETVHAPIPVDEFHILKEELIRSHHEERVHMRGLIELRRDLIVVSVLLVDYVIQKGKVESLHFCAYALKEGAAAELLA
jgi:exopolyphosphatase / guanosine-5'-triphosphate,3'-diphosphate pyrophosphatase